MNSTDIIGYTADADYWCEDCAAVTFPEIDFERDKVMPMFCGAETDSPICCRRCFEPIETTVLDPEGRYTEPDHAPDHDSSECPDCDQRAHADGMGCWCPVCICPNAPGGNDSSDGELCRYCAVTTQPETRSDVWRRKDDSMDALMDDLEDGAARTIDAILSALDLTHTAQDGTDNKLPILTDGQRYAVWDAVAAVSRPVVNAIDVADMIGPGVTISEIEEGIDEHIFLHLGRPGECGNGCPAYVTMPEQEQERRPDTGEMPEIKKRATALGVTEWVATLEMWEDGVVRGIESISSYWYWKDLRHLANLASPKIQGFLEGNEHGEINMARYQALAELGSMVERWIETHFPYQDDCEVKQEPAQRPTASDATKYNPVATHSPSPSEMATLCGLSVFPVSSGRGYINITRNTGAVSCISCRQQLRELGQLPRPIASDVTNP